MKTIQEAAEEYAAGFRTEASQASARLGFNAGILASEHTWYDSEYPEISDKYKPKQYSENVICRSRKHSEEILAWYDHNEKVWKIYPEISGKDGKLDDDDIIEWRPLKWTR